MTKRTPDQRRHDRTLAMMLHLQDFSYKEIARIIEKETGRSISYRQVGYDLKHVRDQWKDQRLDNYEKHIHEELARLDSLEMELWNSWRRSQEGSETKRVEEVVREVMDDEGDDVDLEMIVAKVVTTTNKSPGDTKYLQLIIQVQQERRKLLGLYAPAKLDIQQEHTLNIKGYTHTEHSPDVWPEEKRMDNPDTIEGEVVDAG